MPAPLTISGLVKRFHAQTAVDGISLVVGAGEVVGLLGPNGAGKSTTIACLAGLLRPDAGAISIRGCDPGSDPRGAARHLGVHLQATEVQDTITVAEAVALFARLHGVPPPAGLLAEVGLAGGATTRFRNLSAGQRQCLGLALALVHEPAVLVLDEPTAALDPAARRLVHQVIRQRAARGCAVLLATHHLDEAQRLCDRVVLIDHGAVVMAGTPQELIAASRLPTRTLLQVGDALPLAGWQPSADESVAGERTWALSAADPTRRLAETLAALAAAGRVVRGVRMEPPSLEEVVLQAVDQPRAAAAPAAAVAAVERVAMAPAPAAQPAPWAALLTMASTTLRLNQRQPQALVFGFLVPVFFLIAFGSVFGTSGEAMRQSLGQVLTIAALGGACFGLPIALVSERERGLWRRFRVVPVGPLPLLAGVVLARLVLLVAAGVLVVLIAALGYGMPLPAHPLALLAGYLTVCCGFIGIGLLIAALADSVAAVQAMGQCLFLPMLIIGGVAVPLRMLPEWADHLSRFMPGRYAVGALDRLLIPALASVSAWFPLLVLTLIGACGIVAGAIAFRWSPGALLPRRLVQAGIVGLAPWLAAGLAAELLGAR